MWDSARWVQGVEPMCPEAAEPLRKGVPCKENAAADSKLLPQSEVQFNGPFSVHCSHTTKPLKRERPSKASRTMGQTALGRSGGLHWKETLAELCVRSQKHVRISLTAFHLSREAGGKMLCCPSKVSHFTSAYVSECLVSCFCMDVSPGPTKPLKIK